MDKTKTTRTLSLRNQIMRIVLLCWLLPMLMVLTVLGFYLWADVGRGADKNLTDQFKLNLKMCADRLDTAVEASRLASYDPTIKEAWIDYAKTANYAELYRTTHAFLTRQYGSDSRFVFSVFWFCEDPENMTLTTLSGISGTMYTQISRDWQQDFAAAKELAETLDTSIGFLEQDGRVYLVRNLMDSDYNTVGVLVLALNSPYYFDDLSAMPWASTIEVSLGDAQPILLKGKSFSDDGRTLTAASGGHDYPLTARAEIDYHVLLEPFSSYKYLLSGMALALLPMLLLTVQFLNRKITQPIAALMAGSAQIEKGQLGYQMSYKANSSEFSYLIESFNSMSGQLQNQFNRLYQEELALRDAHIKALQAHINPHFLNNTLEIINWEARMGGNTDVSKMIEALSTVLDAAMDRKRKPEVRLAEEMTYVNAYLYIISVRFGKRLKVTIDLPQELMDYKVPRLILQPVIENAVEHGIGPAGHGEVILRGRLEDNFLILEIENGGGLTREDEEHIARLLSPDYDTGRETSGNIGISNVNLRLKILYGKDCGLSIFRSHGDQVIARLKIAVSGM